MPPCLNLVGDIDYLGRLISPLGFYRMAFDRHCALDYSLASYEQEMYLLTLTLSREKIPVDFDYGL